MGVVSHSFSLIVCAGGLGGIGMGLGPGGQPINANRLSGGGGMGSMGPGGQWPGLVFSHPVSHCAAHCLWGKTPLRDNASPLTGHARQSPSIGQH